MPDELRNSDSFDGFKRFLKTILFSRPVITVTSTLEVFNEMRYIHCTYLLTVISVCEQ